MIRIKINLAAGLLSFLLLAGTTAYAADSAAAIKQRMGSGNPVAGKTSSDFCQGCHGEAGLSAEDLIPNLAGQYASYIAKQLRNFQSGARTHEIMSAMAKTISDAELVDIAAYFPARIKCKATARETIRWRRTYS